MKDAAAICSPLLNLDSQNVVRPAACPKLALSFVKDVAWHWEFDVQEAKPKELPNLELASRKQFSERLPQDNRILLHIYEAEPARWLAAALAHFFLTKTSLAMLSDSLSDLALAGQLAEHAVSFSKKSGSVALEATAQWLRAKSIREPARWEEKIDRFEEAIAVSLTAAMANKDYRSLLARAYTDASRVNPKRRDDYLECAKDTIPEDNWFRRDLALNKAIRCLIEGQAKEAIDHLGGYENEKPDHAPFWRPLFGIIRQRYLALALAKANRGQEGRLDQADDKGRELLLFCK